MKSTAMDSSHNLQLSTLQPSLISYIKIHHPKAFAIFKSLFSFLRRLMDPPQNPHQNAAASDPPPPFDPSAPSSPISYPLKSLDELESRAYFDSFHYPFNRATVELPPGKELPARRRLLVCHDMEGGYKDDRFVQGGENGDAYAIWHWYLIDVFVYFSHNLVTLPPPCWVNAAHRHGVKVLGTFIMEWDEGKVLAKQLLSTKESAQMYAGRLTELAVALGFDGWLINMEVSLDSQQIPNLIEFVSYLSQTMHSLLPGSLVIWYDSVTVDGDLSWQDQLNDKNKPFFDVCDGIFVNYTWQQNYPQLSAEVAGERKHDVYMGIDVFGRGTFGGGQWTTNVALDVIKKDDVSAAIFAPGWLYETKQPPDFQTAQNRWWGLVEQSWGIMQNYPITLPFYSNFDQGHGHHIYVDGKQVSSTPWNNISSQSFQPFIEYSGDTTQPIQVSINFNEASYSGGGNITFIGNLGLNAEFTARLFQGHLLLGNSPILFTYSVKSSENSQLGLVLRFSLPTENKEKSVLLAASGNTLLTMNRFSSHFTSVVMPSRVIKLDQQPDWVMQESTIQMNGHVLTDIRAICYKSNPEKSIAAQYYAALGDLKITTFGESSKFPPANSWLVDNQFVSWISGSEGSKSLSVKLVWQLKVGNADIFPKYNIYVNKVKKTSFGDESEVVNEYIGVAVVKSFYISDLEVKSGVSSVKIVVQVCGADGACQKLEESPFVVLKVQDS